MTARGRPPRAVPAVRVPLYLDARLLARLRRRARDLARSVNGHLVALVARDLGVDPAEYGHEV